MLLINLKGSAPTADFEGFYSRSQVARGLESGDARAEKAILLGPGELEHLPHQVLMRNSPPPFAALFQLRSPSGEKTDRLAEGILAVVTQLSEWIDRKRSALLVGSEVSITSGWGPIKIGMVLRRYPNHSHQEFMQHWFGRHAALGEAVEGVRYRQDHVDLDQTNALAQAAGIEFEEIDGVTESFFASTQEASRIMRRPDVADGAIADEKRFIDHSRSHFGFYRII